MFIDTHPARLDDDDGIDRWGPFRVNSRDDIITMLQRLRDGSVPVNLNAPDGNTLRTALWSLDSAHDRITFSADEHHPQLQRIIECDEAVAVAYLDSVKVQFDVQGMLLVRGAQACVLHAALPQDVYRFQRRSGYRVRPNDRSGPTVRLRHPSLPDMTLVLRVLDVSIGGCALFLPADVPPLQAGSQLDGVRVALDGDTRFTAGLQLHHVTSLSGSDDGSGVRLGCEWKQIDSISQRALQRYIDQMQKRRRLLSLS